MRLGKLNEKELKAALSDIKIINNEVIVSSGIGEDCAVIACNENILISTDPITSICDNIGELVIDINANDIYAGGGIPFAGVLTVIAPTDENSENVIDVIKNAIKKANSEGIDIIGGHTEFSDAVNRTIVSLTILGKTDKFIRNKNCKVGDNIIVSKFLGLEGSRILLSKFPQLHTVLTENEISELFSHSLSVKMESMALRERKDIHAMHDITEGGVYGAVAEVAFGSETGAEIFENKLPILDATRKLCDAIGIEAGGLISSGSMLIITDNEKAVTELLKEAGLNATVVGKITEGKDTYLIKENGEKRLLKVESDNLFKVNEVNL